MNPILALMQKNVNQGTEMVINNNQQNNSMGIISMIKNAKNPNTMLQQLASQNPNVANAMNLVNQYGGDPKKAFYAEAQKRGVDPNQILGLLK